MFVEERWLAQCHAARWNILGKIRVLAIWDAQMTRNTQPELCYHNCCLINLSSWGSENECHNNRDLLRISVITFNHVLILKHSHKHFQNVRETKSFQQEGRWQILFLIQKVNDLCCGSIHFFFSSLTLDKMLSLLLCLWI